MKFVHRNARGCGRTATAGINEPIRMNRVMPMANTFRAFSQATPADTGSGHNPLANKNLRRRL